MQNLLVISGFFRQFLTVNKKMSELLVNNNGIIWLTIVAGIKILTNKIAFETYVEFKLWRNRKQP